MSAGNKLMPGDHFLELKINKGVLTVDGKTVKGGIKDGKLKVQFMKGRADNPKVNAIMLV